MMSDVNGERVVARLASLRSEYAQGTEVLAQLEAQAREIRDQLLRIGGAIRICEELLLDGGTTPVT